MSLRQAPTRPRRPSGSRHFGTRSHAARLPASAYGLALVSFVIYGAYAWSRHTQYLTAGYDLGIFDQAMRHYAHFHAPIVSLKGDGFNLLGDHFHPIIALLTPLYWIWTDPRMLLLAQAALVAASILPVFRFAERHLGRPSAYPIVIAYALSWPIQLMIDFDFHEIAFAVPLIAVVIDALDRHAYRVVVAACVVLLFVREDMGMFVLAVAVLIAFRRRMRLGVVLGVIGLVGYVLATAVAIPAFSPTNSFAYWSYDALGHNLPSALWNSIRNPWRVVKTFFTPAEKTHTLLWILAVPAFTCIGSWYVLLAFPFLAERFLSSRTHLWNTQFHYSAVVAPIVVMAGVTVIGRLRGRSPIRKALLAVILALPVFGMVFDLRLFPFGRMVNGSAWRHTAHMTAISEGTSRVPAHVCVEADDRLLPHLVGRDYLSPVGASGGKATWIFLDLKQHETGFQGPAPSTALASALARGFRVVFEQNQIVLLRSDAPVDAVCRGPLS
jgi:uncharacterized membrane protein